MKGKLVAVIDEAKKLYVMDDESDCDESEFIAGHLLESGMLLPPIKIGGSIYTISPYKYISEYTVVGYHFSYIKKAGNTALREYFVCESRHCTHTFHLKVGELGKTVFATYAEALAALKE